jgi:NAD(P)-dependent dehydrogenase (short-subunit alcohol dehydrogenase family)
MVETEDFHSAGIAGSDFQKTVEAQTPLGRIGQPDDIGPVASFLPPRMRAGSPARPSSSPAAIGAPRLMKSEKGKGSVPTIEMVSPIDS